MSALDLNYVVCP